MSVTASARAVSRRQARILYVCFVLSGAAGLVYEVVWAQLLGKLVGGTTATHTVVLAAFMGGLALGNRFGGRWADTGIAPLRLYAYLEGIVGTLGVLSPHMADLAGAAYVALAPTPDSGAYIVDFGLRLVLAAVTILPASFAMGATLPALVRACTTSLGGLGGSVGWLYFINSVGAVIGAGLAGFYLIPQFGLDLSVTIAGTFNLVLALVALVLASRTSEDDPPAADTAPAPLETPARTYTETQVNAAVAAVFLSGAAAMVVEIVWTRVLGLTMGGSAHAFSIMLMTFIAGIAFGGVIAARVSRGDADAYRPLVIAEVVAAVSLILLLPWYDRMPFVFHSLGSVVAPIPEGYTMFLAMGTVVAVLAMAVPTLALGATLPLASRVVTSSLGHAGRKVGGVFSINTLGNVIGAATSGLILVPLIGLEPTMRVGAFLLLLAAARVALVDVDLRKPAMAGGGVLLFLLILMPSWDPVLLHSGLYRSLRKHVGSVASFRQQAAGANFLMVQDDSEASVAVVENDVGVRLLRVNGKSDASNRGDVPTQLMVGHLPNLFHGAPKRVLVVGLGSGITVGAVLTHPSIERVDVVEISPAVVAGSRFFDEWSGAPLDDPRVHLYERDARNFIRVLPDDVKYDVIVSQPSNPWQVGSAALFTLEYFRQLQSRLAPGGVMSHWMHLYEVDDIVVESVLRGFGRVFPLPRVFNPKRNDVVFVASDGPLKADLGVLKRSLSAPAVAASLRRVTPDKRPMDLPTLLFHELIGPTEFRAFFGKAETDEGLHTDRYPVLPYRGPQAFFVGKRSTLLQGSDARRLPRARSGLLIAELLGSAPNDPELLATVDSYVAARDFKIDDKVARAVALTRYDMDPADPERISRLDEVDALVDIGRRLRFDRMDATGPPSTPDACEKRLRYEFAQVSRRTSVYTRPSWAAFDAIMKRCKDIEGLPRILMRDLGRQLKIYRVEM